MKVHYLLKAITTSTELAVIIGKDISVASRIMTGSKKPTMEQVYLMIDAFPQHLNHEMFKEFYVTTNKRNRK